MRLALAQINSVVGDLDGNAARIVEWLDEARDAERRPRPLPRARRHRLSGRGPAPPARVRPRRAAGGRRDRQGDARDHRARRRAPPRRRPLQRVLRARRTARCGASTASATCRTTASSTRTATSRPGDDLVLLRFGDDVVGADDLRGRVAARAARDRPRARRRATDREHLAPRRSTSARTASARRC